MIEDSKVWGGECRASIVRFGLYHAEFNMVSGKLWKKFGCHFAERPYDWWIYLSSIEIRTNSHSQKKEKKKKKSNRRKNHGTESMFLELFWIFNLGTVKCLHGGSAGILDVVSR